MNNRNSFKSKVYFPAAVTDTQSPCINSDSEILGVCAMISMFLSARFRSPRSMPPMYVRSKPHSAAKLS